MRHLVVTVTMRGEVCRGTRQKMWINRGTVCVLIVLLALIVVSDAFSISQHHRSYRQNRMADEDLLQETILELLTDASKRDETVSGWNSEQNVGGRKALGNKS